MIFPWIEILIVIGQALGEVASLDTKKIMLVKALLVSRDTLLEELQKISKGIGHVIDLSDFISNMDDMRMVDSIMQGNLGTADGEVSGQGKPHNGLEVLPIIFIVNKF